MLLVLKVRRVQLGRLGRLVTRAPRGRQAPKGRQDRKGLLVLLSQMMLTILLLSPFSIRSNNGYIFKRYFECFDKRACN